MTAEELHSLVMAKKVTYAAIYKIDPVKFSDLEPTMRMLYDHGDKPADNYSSPTISIVSSSAQGVSPRTPQTASPPPPPSNDKAGGKKGSKAIAKTGSVQLPAKRKATKPAAAPQVATPSAPAPASKPGSNKASKKGANPTVKSEKGSGAVAAAAPSSNRMSSAPAANRKGRGVADEVDFSSSSAV